MIVHAGMRDVRGHAIELGPDLSPGPPVPVFTPPYHTSYPHVFAHAGRLFMIPETSHHRTIDLYEWAPTG